MFNWYRLINQDEFLASGLPSYKFEVELIGIGLKEIMITHGNFVSILVDDIFLPINLNSKNPYRYGERAVSLDENNDIWVGFYSEDI